MAGMDCSTSLTSKEPKLGEMTSFAFLLMQSAPSYLVWLRTPHFPPHHANHSSTTAVHISLRHMNKLMRPNDPNLNRALKEPLYPRY
jgi:hypothetical protein